MWLIVDLLKVSASAPSKYLQSALQFDFTLFPQRSCACGTSGECIYTFNLANAKYIYSTSTSMTPSAKLVSVVLVCYFGFVMYRAGNKLQSRDVGTMFATKSEETVQGYAF